MREVENPQMQIGDIFVNPNSRDDMPVLLISLQLIYTEKR